MSNFNLPDLGEGLAEAEIREWHVKEGDVIKYEQPLLSVETAKALVDIPSPQAGKVTKLFGKPGDIIQVGSPLMSFEDDNSNTASKSDGGTVVGKLETAQRVIKESAVGITPTQTQKETIKTSPAVRALAKSLQVDLSKIKPTGYNETITLEDVQQAARITPPTITKTTATPEISNTETALTEANVIVLRGARRAMVQSMTRAQNEIVPVTLMDQADIQAWKPDADFTLRIVRAIAQACRIEPALNAHFNGKQLEKKLFTEVNLGVAVDTVDGLYVPVIKNVLQLSDSDLRKEINHFKSAAQERNFPLPMLQGATITLSNFGTIAGRYSNPIVVPPTVAIVGIGKAFLDTVAKHDQIAIHRILPISLTFDHRACTGGEAARFLAALIENLEK